MSTSYKEKVYCWACKCGQCGHTWRTRTDLLPNICPKCKSMRWDTSLEGILDRSAGDLTAEVKEKYGNMAEEVVLPTQEKVLKVVDRSVPVFFNPRVAEEPQIWEFTKDKPWFHDDGNVYRKQKLSPEYKRERTVRVDEEDHELILGVMK